MKKDEKHITNAIEFYRNQENKILDFFNNKDELRRKYRLGSDVIIHKAKELEQIIIQISAEAKNFFRSSDN